jgi:hypothetical protein
MQTRLLVNTINQAALLQYLNQGLLIAVTAINRFAAIRLERYLGRCATSGTNHIKHLTGRPGSTAATITAAAATSTATAITATTTRLTLGFGGIPAGFAFTGLAKAPLGIKRLFFISKTKNIAARRAANFDNRHRENVLLSWDNT